MSKRINDIFSGIYDKYDLMNHLFSFGFDILWRKDAARLAFVKKDSINILDFGTGTGDLAIELSRLYSIRGLHARITGLDFNKDMLSIAVEKARSNHIQNIRFARGDAAHTKYGNGSFDLIVSGFTLRNIDDLAALSRECKRLLRPGGSIAFLDMAYPDGMLSRVYFSVHLAAMKTIGSIVNREAYDWLAYSIRHFDKRRLASILRRDFRDIVVHPLVPNIAYVVTATRYR